MTNVNMIGKVLELWGATTTIVPIGMPAQVWNGQAVGENAARTTVTSVHGGSGVNAVFTYQPGTVSAFATLPFYRRNPYRNPVIVLNNSTEYLTAPDAAYWSIGDSLVDSPCSFGISIRWIGAPGLDVFIAKYNGASGEWGFGSQVVAAGRPALLLRDPSAAVACYRTVNAALVTNTDYRIVATYDGGGGATAANGIVIYVNGLVVASTATNNASYVATENGAALPTIADNETVGNPLGGFMDGGGFGPIFNKGTALTAAQVATEYEMWAQYCLRNRNPIRLRVR